MRARYARVAFWASKGDAGLSICGRACTSMFAVGAREGTACPKATVGRNPSMRTSVVSAARNGAKTGSPIDQARLTLRWKPSSSHDKMRVREASVGAMEMQAMSAAETRYIDRPDGARIAYVIRNGASPAVMWLGGFNSAMDGNKARALDAWAVREGRAFVLFDYFGHGASTGRFREGTVSRWRDDAVAVLDELTFGPQIL